MIAVFVSVLRESGVCVCVFVCLCVFVSESSVCVSESGVFE